MVGILDIAPAARRVDLRGSEISVTGLSLVQFRDIVEAFPEVAKLLSGKPDVGALIMTSPEAVAAVIAAGLGATGKEAEAVINLVLDDQLLLLTQIIDLTVDKSIAPFEALMEKLGAVGKRAAASPMRGLATNSQLPPPA